MKTGYDIHREKKTMYWIVCRQVWYILVHNFPIKQLFYIKK